jgi:hypothetical protein
MTVATLNDDDEAARRTKGGRTEFCAAIRPLLKGGVGYEIDGNIVRVFRGRDAMQLRDARVAPLIAQLFAALDGTNTRAEVIKALPGSLMALGDQIVSALERKGMVVEGPERGIPEGIPPEVARLSQEYGDGWEDRLIGWSTTDVRVEGPKAMTERICEILEAQGARRVHVARRNTPEISEGLSIHINSGASLEHPEWTIGVAFGADGATVTRGAGRVESPVPCPDATITPLASDLAIAIASLETLKAVLLGQDCTTTTLVTTITNEGLIIPHERRERRRQQKRDPPSVARAAARYAADRAIARNYPVETKGTSEEHAEENYAAISYIDIPAEKIDFDDDWSMQVRSLARLIAMYWGEVPVAAVLHHGEMAMATTTVRGEVVTARARDEDRALRNSLTLLVARLQKTALPEGERAARTGDAVRNFAVLTSERRSENIGAMWGNVPEAEHVAQSADDTRKSSAPFRTARVHDLPPTIATADLDHGGHGLTCYEKVAEIVRHTVLPIWLEVGYDLQTSVHRPLPSGGNKHEVKLLVECDLGHGRSMHEVDVYNRRLVETDIPVDESKGARDVTFHVEARDSEMLYTYGEFGLCLLLIEAGAMRAQIETLACTLGLTASRTGGTWSGTPCDRILRATILTLSMAAQPKNDGVRDEIEAAKEWTARPVAPELDAMIDEMVRAGARTADRIAATGSVIIREPFKWTRERTSNGRIGTGRYDKASQEVVADILRSIAEYEGGPYGIGCDAIMLDDQGVTSRWATGDDGPKYTPLRRREAAAANTALSGNAAVLTIHARHGFASDGDVNSYVDAHMVAGEILQAVGLNAARHGWYARGYRALPDLIVGATLTLDRRPLLQIQIGPRAGRLRYRLA